MPGYMSLDFETSIQYKEVTVPLVGKANKGKFKTVRKSSEHGPSWKDPKNDIYSIIYGDKPDNIKMINSEKGFNRALTKEVGEMLLRSHTIIGVNLKFDLGYIWQDAYFQKFLSMGGKLWDCQIAAYLLGGQRWQFPSLGEMQKVILGKKTKVGAITKLFKRCIGADEIIARRHERKFWWKAFKHYGIEDGKTPMLIMQKQHKEAKTKGMLPIIELYNQYLLALTMMEVNGIPVDLPAVEVLYKEFSLKVVEYLSQATDIVKPLWTNPNLPALNINSPSQSSLILFGGTIKVQVRRGTGVINKSGNNKGLEKTKLFEEIVHIDGFGLDPKFSRETAKEGYYSTDKAVIENIYKGSSNAEAKEYCRLLKLSGTYKQKISTYLNAMLYKSVDGIIRANYNNTETSTSRLSASSPNLQNIPAHGEFGASIPALLIAPPGWVCASIDFSQLEVLCQAMLSQDYNLCRDINDGVDFHCVEESTEVLTVTGWVEAKSLPLNAYLIVSDHDGQQVISPIVDYWKQSGKPLLRVKGDLSDELVTFDHKLFIDGQLHCAKDFIGVKLNQTRFRYSLSGSPHLEYYTDDQLRLLVWALTDAHVFKRCGTQKVSGIRWKLSKPRKIEALKHLLDRMGVPYKVNNCPKTGLNKLQPLFIIVYGEWQNWIFEHIGFDKHYPENFRYLGPSQAKVVYDTLAITDGCIQGAHLVLASVSVEGLSLLQDMFMLNGFATKITQFNYSSEFNNRKYTETLCVYPNVYSRRYVEVAEAGVGNIVGITSTTGTLITKRNGKIQVTGNCKRLCYIEPEYTYEEILKLTKVDKVGDWPEKRSKAKVISFQKAYGAAPESLAKITELPLELVKEIFEKEDIEYPQVKEFDDGVAKEVQHSAVLSRKYHYADKATKGGKDSKGVPRKFLGDVELLPIKEQDKKTYTFSNHEYRHVGFYVSPTGKRYAFLEFGSRRKDGDIFRYYKPTQMKNYGMQGSAGDIQAVTTVEMFQLLLKHPDKVKLINEIHDSKWFLIKSDYLACILDKLCSIMRNTHQLLEKRFEVKIGFNFEVEAKIGRNFSDMEVYDSTQ